MVRHRPTVGRGGGAPLALTVAADAGVQPMATLDDVCRFFAAAEDGHEVVCTFHEINSPMVPKQCCVPFSRDWFGVYRRECEGIAGKWIRRDIPALVEVLSEELALRNDMPPPELLPDALALLAGQTWRGNIRELRNVLEQAAMRSEDTAINAEQLREVLRSSGVEPAAPAPGPETAPAPSSAHNSPADTDLLRPLAQQVAELERKAITATLAANSGNKLATARQLGISRATLYDRMAVLELGG